VSKRLAPAELPDWPARMQAPLAAAYLGISPTKLHVGVEVGRYPAPRPDGGNALWHRVDLDRYLARERGEAEDGQPEAAEPAAIGDAMMEAIRAGNQAQARKRSAA